MTVLQTVIVGQCEVFACLDFVHFFFFFPLATKGVSILKKMSIFPKPTPLILTQQVVCGTPVKLLRNIQEWFFYGFPYKFLVVTIVF